MHDRKFLSKTFSLCLFAFLAVPFLRAQERELRGWIQVSGASPGGVHIVNLVNEQEVLSDNEGFFYIRAKPDDVLVLSGGLLDHMRHIVESADFMSGKFTVFMTAKAIELDQVNIRNNLNAVNLGILARTPKKYTPAERKLRTATDLNPKLGAGMMMGGSISLDPLMNWISGRTKKLKAEVGIEQREFAMKSMEDQYSDAYLTKKLALPQLYCKAFRFYCAEDKDLAAALKDEESQLADFLLIGLARDFNALLGQKQQAQFQSTRKESYFWKP